jgi:hypothetical protein
MLVNNTRAFVTFCGPVRFLPGVNTVDKEGVRYLETDKSFKERCDLGILKLIDPSGNETKEVADQVKALTIDQLNATEACKVVKGVLDRVELMRLREGEKRATVLAAIEVQLKKMNEPERPPQE